ncbi:hypothetical protein Tco_1141430 [Tanacetum coccineum]
MGYTTAWVVGVLVGRPIVGRSRGVGRQALFCVYGQDNDLNVVRYYLWSIASPHEDFSIPGFAELCLHATSLPDTKARTSSASPIYKCQKQCIAIVVQPKFDMPSYESEMTSKDVKSLALRHGIPLDLHPVALTKGWTMDQLPDDIIGLYEQYFEFSGIRVPFSTFLLAVHSGSSL